MVIALLALLAADDGWRDACRVLVDKGDTAAAADCYGDAAAADDADDDDAALAVALADVVSHARLRAFVVHAPVAANNGFDLGDFAFSGKAEVTGLAFFNGSIVGSAVVGGAASAGVALGSLTLAPVVGGVVAGGGAAGALILLDDQLSPGDVHVLRLGLLLAPYEALTASALLASASSGINGTATAATVVAVEVVTVAAAVGVVVVSDVDAAAPSLATSFGWIGGTTAALLWAASDVEASNAAQQLVAVGALGANLGVVGGFVAAPALQVTRPATLLIDAGGLAGFLVGSALAFGLNAPNPQLGYGGIAVAGVVGAGVGVVGAVAVSADGGE